MVAFSFLFFVPALLAMPFYIAPLVPVTLAMVI
jgi:hypothetical protein